MAGSQRDYVAAIALACIAYVLLIPQIRACIKLDKQTEPSGKIIIDGDVTIQPKAE